MKAELESGKVRGGAKPGRTFKIAKTSISTQKKDILPRPNPKAVNAIDLLQVNLHK